MTNRNRTATAVLVVVMAGLAACAAPTTEQAKVDTDLERLEAEKQKELLVHTENRQRARLYGVAFNVARAAAPMCNEKTRKAAGFTPATRDLYPEALRDAANKTLGLDSAIKVLWIAPGSPAERAGLKIGDRVTAVNGLAVSVGKEGYESYKQKWLQQIKEKKLPIRMDVVRDSKPHTVTMAPVEICGYPIEFKNEEAINAFADGKKIYLTKGMMRFVESDTELALVIAHELAHNSMKHIEAKIQNQRAGGFGGLLFDVLAAAAGVNTGGAFADAGAKAGAGAYSQEFESEADYVGLYAVARAGYKFEEAPFFWRRMATLSAKSIVFAGSHPTTANRFVALDNAVKEIKRKKSEGSELFPEVKKKKEPVTAAPVGRPGDGYND